VSEAKMHSSRVIGPNARYLPFEKWARRLERNMSRTHLPFTKQRPSPPAMERLETLLRSTVAAFQKNKLKTKPNLQIIIKRSLSIKFDCTKNIEIVEVFYPVFPI
jgi:hypothetical protein